MTGKAKIFSTRKKRAEQASGFELSFFHTLTNLTLGGGG